MLRLGPASSLVMIAKVTVFASKSTEARNKTEVLFGLKKQPLVLRQSTGWLWPENQASADGHFLLMLIDEDSLQKQKAVSVCPF